MIISQITLTWTFRKRIFNKTLSPNEVLKGLVPGEDLFPNLENRILEAKNLRMMTNLMICCKD